MTCNVGKTDKWIRIIIGIIILAWGVSISSWFAVIGIALILTGLFSFCGLYKLLGISTCKKHPT